MMQSCREPPTGTAVLYRSEEGGFSSTNPEDMCVQGPLRALTAPGLAQEILKHVPADSKLAELLLDVLYADHVTVDAPRELRVTVMPTTAGIRRNQMTMYIGEDTARTLGRETWYNQVTAISDGAIVYQGPRAGLPNQYSRLRDIEAASTEPKDGILTDYIEKSVRGVALVTLANGTQAPILMSLDPVLPMGQVRMDQRALEFMLGNKYLSTPLRNVTVVPAILPSASALQIEWLGDRSEDADYMVSIATDTLSTVNTVCTGQWFEHAGGARFCVVGIRAWTADGIVAVSCASVNFRDLGFDIVGTNDRGILSAGGTFVVRNASPALLDLARRYAGFAACGEEHRAPASELRPEPLATLDRAAMAAARLERLQRMPVSNVRAPKRALETEAAGASSVTPLKKRHVGFGVVSGPASLGPGAAPPSAQVTVLTGEAAREVRSADHDARARAGNAHDAAVRVAREAVSHGAADDMPVDGSMSIIRVPEGSLRQAVVRGVVVTRPGVMLDEIHERAKYPPVNVLDIRALAAVLPPAPTLDIALLNSYEETVPLATLVQRPPVPQGLGVVRFGSSYAPAPAVPAAVSSLIANFMYPTTTRSPVVFGVAPAAASRLPDTPLPTAVRDSWSPASPVVRISQPAASPLLTSFLPPTSTPTLTPTVTTSQPPRMAALPPVPTATPPSVMQHDRDVTNIRRFSFFNSQGGEVPSAASQPSPQLPSPPRMLALPAAAAAPAANATPDVANIRRFSFVNPLTVASIVAPPPPVNEFRAVPSSRFGLASSDANIVPVETQEVSLVRFPRGADDHM